VCAYHLRYSEAKRKLNIQWQGVRIDHMHNSKYLEMKLDRAQTYKINDEIIYSKN